MSGFWVEAITRTNQTCIDGFTTDRIINIQRSWLSNRRNADAAKGFIATAFTEDEVQNHFDIGATFFLLKTSSDILGFSLITEIEELTDQFCDAKGYCHFYDSGLNLDSYLYLYQMVVVAGMERQGLGTSLLNEVRRCYGRPIVADVLVNPVPNIPSIRFFERHGFKRIGEIHLDSYRDFGALTSHMYLHLPPLQNGVSFDRVSDNA